MLNITILYGCVREERQSIRAAKGVLKALEKTGKAHVTFIDLKEKEYELPVMTARLKDMKNPLENAVRISKHLKNADGIIFITPEYNNSYSGAFKNAVDYFTTEWSKKPIGIVCASNGRQGGINASNLLQLLVLAVNAFPMPYKLLVPELENSFDEEGNAKTEIMQKNLEHFITEYFDFVGAMRSVS
jgi:NAD(P)H-dependent FMN reductase